MIDDPDPHPHMTIAECIMAGIVIVLLLWLSTC
jgi:hypothetical protein